MGASNHWSNCQRTEHRVGLEPTSPHYGCGILAAGRPVLVIQWDQRGSNPHRVRLRARHAATSTLIPYSCFASRCFSLRAHSARRESNPRRDPYKRPALTTELRAAAIAGQSQLSGAEGSRTLTIPLKRRKRYRYATTPIASRAYAFEPLCSLHRFSFDSELSEVESSNLCREAVVAGDVSDRYAPVTAPAHIRRISREGRSRTDCFVLPRHAGHRSPSSRLHFLSSSYGNRTHLSALKGQYPQADRRTSHRCLLTARTLSASGSGGARILVSWSSAKR